MKLTPMDAAFLSRDRYERRGHTNIFVAVRPQRKLTLDDLRSLVQEKWGSIPRLYVSASPERCRIESRVIELSAAPDGDMTAAVGRFLAQETGPNEPPWQLALIRGAAPDGTVLCFKARHALMDGLSMLALFKALLGGREIGDSAAPNEWEFAGGDLARGLGMFARRICSPAATLPFQVRADGSRHVIHVPVAADIIDRIVNEHPGATPNHILLAGVSGAMRTVATRSGNGLPDRIYAAIPVATSFDRSHQGQLANHFVPLRIRLPVTVPGSRERMEVIRARCQAEITRPRIRAAQAVMALMAGLPAAVSRPLFRYGFSHVHFSLIASCLPNITRLAAEEVTGSPHVMGRVPLAVTLSGPPRRLACTIVADAAIRPYAAELAAAFAAELHHLARAASAHEPMPPVPSRQAANPGISPALRCQPAARR